MHLAPTLACRSQTTLHRHRTRCSLLGLLVASIPLTFAVAQSSGVPSGEPIAWVQAAAGNEVAIINDDGSHPLRYRVRKVDKRGDTTRDVIEAREGSVARLIEQDGMPITAAEDAAERARLQATLDSPADFIKHHKRDVPMRNTVDDLVRLMPRAMLWTYAVGQPQITGALPQVVLDFKPDPKFKPPTIASELLTGIEGRLWIDQRTQHLVRGEAHVLQPIDLGWGMLVRVYPGGTVEFEQQDAGNGRWTYSKLVEHLTAREMMIKTSVQNAVSTSYNFQPLHAPVSFQEAVRILLGTSVPLR